ncbi:hypothetical protein MRS44_011926 [Fusarium solani]|uniref:uncharacterized protein n=1 Tax=Fusarium solani TaxID=169388 RepID=UPI0032C425D8|nr:hypothetical protein MRS44_011926 [Fusarium solani]
MENLTEKQLLGVKMMHELFGPELFDAHKANSRDDLPSKVGAEYITETCFSSAGLNNGLQEEQFTEAYRHAMVYCGVPAGRDALLIASEVFEERKAASKRAESAKLS